MTYPANHKKIHNPARQALPSAGPESRIRQEGVTLFLAILVLSSLLAISFSLATILFIEVRTSSDLAKTEGALAGANGVAEQALYNVKRSVTCDPTNATTPHCYEADFNNHVALNGQPVNSTIANPFFVDKVLSSSNNLTDTINKYDFCATSAPSNLGCGYGKVTITYEPTGNNDELKVNLCEFDAEGSYATAPCTDLTDNYWVTGHTGQSLYPTDPPLSFTFTPGLQQELILYNGNPTATQNIYVLIQTFADDAQLTPKGLPYANKTAVSVSAINAQVGRKIKVIVPNGPGTPTSGTPSTNTSFVTSTSLGSPNNSFTGWVGMWFKVGPAPVTVKSLGRIVIAGNSASHALKLVDVSTGLDVPGSSVTVSTVGGTPGSFVYANLTSPVTLSANTDYYLLSQETAGSDQFYDQGNTTVTGQASIATVQGSVYYDSFGFSPFPSASNQTYGPVDFQY